MPDVSAIANLKDLMQGSQAVAPVVNNPAPVATPGPGEVAQMNSTTSAKVVDPKNAERVFYSRFDGACLTTPKGKKIKFSNGVFRTSDPEEIAHILDCYTNSKEVVSLEPVAVIQNDAHILRDVGMKSNTQAMNSLSIAQLAANSGA